MSRKTAKHLAGMLLSALLVATVAFFVGVFGADAQIEGRKLTDSSIPTASSLNDADLLYVVQTAISKKVTWSTLKNSDMPLYVKLAGRAGGQTINGGTAANQALNLNANSADGFPQISIIDHASNPRISMVTTSISPHELVLDNSGIYGSIKAGAPFYILSSGAVVNFQVNNDGDAGVLGRMRFGSALTDASAACLWRNGSDALIHDTDCDSTADLGEDDLSVDDDVPDTDGEILDNITIASSADLGTAGHVRVGHATTDASAACVSRDAGADRLYHDKDCSDAKGAGEAYLDENGYALTIVAGNAATMTDAQTIYFGGLAANAPSTTDAIQQIVIPFTGTITKAVVFSRAGTAGTGESWTLNLRLNSSSDTAIASVASATASRTWTSGALSVGVTAGDFVEIKSVNPTWATNPANVAFGGAIYVSVP